MTDLPRDRNGNPLIRLVDGTIATYTRASQFGDVLDDRGGLQAWGEGMVVRGFAISSHIRSLVDLADPDDAKSLRAIARKAKEIAGASTASDLGSAIHRSLERIDLGHTTIDTVEGRFRPLVDTYIDTLDQHGLTIVDAERLVVCDEVEAAGTLDRLVRTRTGDVVVADLKTGKSIFPTSKTVACQLSIYAHASAYDPTTGGRTAFEGLRQDVALVIHLPANGQGCTIYTVDTERGFEMCHLAREVRKARKEELITRLVA